MPPQSNNNAVILLSGGLDSYTAAAMAKSQGHTCYGLTIDYGQRHRLEIAAAANVARALALADHKTVPLDLRWIGHSALTDDIDVPKKALDPSSDQIPITYVPARNTIFLALALAWAETLNAFDIFIGVNALDYSGYPDCRPDFIVAFTCLANLATKAAVENQGKFRIHTPLIQLTKADIIKKGLAFHLDYALTHSCYDPTPADLPCGQCDSCQLRLKGFQQAGAKDPVQYATHQKL